MIKKILLLVITLALSYSFASIKPNPLISRFKPIYASFPGSPSALVNGKFGETAWAVKDSSWIALKLETGPSAVFFSWNALNTRWSDSIGFAGTCAGGLSVPESYAILVSGNSTNGKDGTWKTTDSVTDNTVAARGHNIDFTGSFWIKMQVFSGEAKIDEVEVFDISNGNEDTWFFAGTGITANAFKNPVQQKTFSFYIKDILGDAVPGVYPAFIRGGNDCLTSSAMAADIDKFLKIAGNVSYFAIELGTYDAWGGLADGVVLYTANLQKIINACRAKKIEPILARIPATNPEAATWQVHSDYLAAIDNLVRKNRLIPGPDLYTWFLQHSDELNPDGVTPSLRGGASIQRLWAESVYMLYQDKAEK